jgi:hypothetical protein
MKNKATTSLLACFTMVALMASISIAGSDNGNGYGVGATPPSTIGGTKGMGASTTKYTATYTDPVFGPVTCTGVHQSGHQFPTLGQDSFTCVAQPEGATIANVVPNQILTLPPGGWYSDFYFLSNQLVFNTSFSGAVSEDGTSYTGVAQY